MLAFDPADTTTFGAAITGTGVVAQLGGGTTILTGTGNTYSGGTTIAAGGTLQIGNGALDGSLGTGPVADNGVLAFDPADTTTFGAAITGTGVVAQLGGGTTILTGTGNTYSGGTTIAAGGTLQIGNGALDGSLGTGPVADNGVLAFDPADTTTFGAAITGTGVVAQLGGGTTILTGTGNTYSGGTTIAAGGTLQIGNGALDGSLGTGPVADNGVLAFDPADTTTFGAAITGTGVVAQLGGGTTILTGTGNTYSGGTTIAAGGTLQIGNGALDGSLGTGPVADNGVLAFDPADTTTFGAAITGTGVVAQLGGGTTILTGTGNTYSGGTTIAAGGTLQIGNGALDGSLGTGPVADNGVLAFDPADATTFGAAITGTGVVAQLGGGTTILTGTGNTYSGGTVIAARHARRLATAAARRQRRDRPRFR